MTILVIIIILFALGCALAVPIALALVLQNRNDKKKAYMLLKEPSPNLKALNRYIRRLSGFHDEESRELVRQLMTKRQVL